MINLVMYRILLGSLTIIEGVVAGSEYSQHDWVLGVVFSLASLMFIYALGKSFTWTR